MGQIRPLHHHSGGCRLNRRRQLRGHQGLVYEKLQTWSDSYAYALSLQNQGKYDESIDTFDYIAGKDYGIFSDLAKMQKANILLEQKKNDEAFKLMNEIIEDKSFNPQLRDTTILKLASYKLDNAPAEEIEELIGGIAADGGNSWQPTANEMLALAYLRDGKPPRRRKSTTVFWPTAKRPK